MANSVCRLLRDGPLAGEGSILSVVHEKYGAFRGFEVFFKILRDLSKAVAEKRAHGSYFIFVCSKCPPEYYKMLAGDTFLCTIDCYNDPLGWKQEDNSGTNVAESTSDGQCTVSDLTALSNNIDQRLKGSSSKAYIVFDSLTLLMACSSVSKICALLDSLKWSDKVSGIMGYFHEENGDSIGLSSLEYISNTLLGIKEAPNYITESDGGVLGLIHFRYKKRNGRVKEDVELYSEGPDGSLTFKNPNSISSASEVQKKTNYGIGELTFNISLSEKEKYDRASVKLPYEHKGEGIDIKIYDGRKEEMGGKNSKLGEVHYVRDSDEELPDSDEDPDDDLDI